MKPVSLLKTHKTLSNCWSLPDGKFAFFYAFVHENRLLSEMVDFKARTLWGFRNCCQINNNLCSGVKLVKIKPEDTLKSPEIRPLNSSRIRKCTYE